MLRGRIDRTHDRVACTGARHWLRATRQGTDPTEDVMVVESATLSDPRWRRVDHDLVLLTRAAIRLVTADPVAARAFTAAAHDLAGLEQRDAHPVTGLVRVTYPLLAGAPPWPLAAIPAVLPEDLQPAFRSVSPRQASRLLFPGRGTRPVARSLAELLTDGDPADLFVLTSAVAAAPLLEPDVLARVLGHRCPASGGDRTPLGTDEREGLRRVLTPLGDAHRRRLLRTGLTDPGNRARLRFVASQAPRDLEVPARPDWESLALTVALGAPVPA